MVHRTSVRLLMLSALVSAILGAVDGQAQTAARNNPYSPSPIRKIGEPSSVPDKPAAPQMAFVVNEAPTAAVRESASQSPAVPRVRGSANAAMRHLGPTETYKVGVGDVLFVNLKNSARGGGHYTVRTDGTIDYPLAGEDVVVANQTTDGISYLLSSRITLFPDPQVEVKVREYGSHRINVSGLVERPGEKKLQREAVPLYVIKADAVVDAKAAKVIITRAPLLKPETYSLRDPNTDNILIQPGNSVEFVAGAPLGSYFISGAIGSSGQKEMSPGLTLYQAVAANGGATGNAKKILVRRKNETGVVSVLEFKLQAIKEGKISDPPVLSGDTIEISN